MFKNIAGATFIRCALMCLLAVCAVEVHAQVSEIKLVYLGGYPSQYPPIGTMLAVRDSMNEQGRDGQAAIFLGDFGAINREFICSVDLETSVTLNLNKAGDSVVMSLRASASKLIQCENFEVAPTDHSDSLMIWWRDSNTSNEFIIVIPDVPECPTLAANASPEVVCKRIPEAISELARDTWRNSRGNVLWIAGSEE